MTKKEKIDEVIFDSNDSYITKTGIRNFTSKTPKEAEKLFNACKKVEKSETDKRMNKYGLSYEDLDLSPNKVQINTLFKVLGLNYNFEMNRYKKRKEEGK